MRIMRTSFITAFSLLSFAAGSALADVPPKRSKNFTGNYQTLVKDQQASPTIADCIATAYDVTAKSRSYDRLGFTKSDIAASKTEAKTQKFSTKDSTSVSEIISVPGEARQRKGDGWSAITLRCGIRDGKLKAIEIVASAQPAKAAN